MNHSNKQAIRIADNLPGNQEALRCTPWKALNAWRRSSHMGRALEWGPACHGAHRIHKHPTEMLSGNSKKSPVSEAGEWK